MIRTGDKKIKPYAKFGFVVSKGEILKDIILNNSNPLDPFRLTSKEIFSGGTAFGLQSGVGFSYQLSQSFSLFCEANNINMTYSPTRGLVIETTSNGVDLLPQMSKQNKETIFVKELDSTIIPDEFQSKTSIKGVLFVWKHWFSSWN